MTARALVLVLAVVACNGASHQTRSVDETVPGESLVGAWDARLSLTHPYPLALNSPVASRICGTIGFVENHHESGLVPAGTPSLGVYDLDLSRLGLNWLDDNAFPAALVSSPTDGARQSDRTQRDSITIVLNPGSSERIVLLGRHDGAGIVGKWVAQSARGTASGSFSLRAHDRVRPSC